MHAFLGDSATRGFTVDEKVLEEIEFHQDTLSSDSNSPLQLIREKEMEITGRVLTAKREAEEIVAAARKKAVETTHRSEEESERLVAQHEKDVLAEVDREIEQIKENAGSEIESLGELVATRTDKAVEFVIETVTSV